MSEQVIASKNKVLVKGMSLKGGDLPSNYQIYVNVEFDYTGLTLEDLQGLCSEGSSIRVKAQSQLRKWTIKKLENHGCEGIDGMTKDVKEYLEDVEPIKFDVSTDFEKSDRGPQDPVKQGVKALSKMDDTQKVRFLREAGFGDEADKLQDQMDVFQDGVEESGN